MPFKTNLKAGILLYAMFMTSIFFAGFTGLPFSSDSSTQGIPSSN
ncbi:comG operon protein 6 [Streptococcus pyogenes]|nr:comG operon protein 6 [Streptococcus pyogenes]VHF24141.1 comG operon protein 6 [Streptococcus pyogenes]